MQGHVLAVYAIDKTSHFIFLMKALSEGKGLHGSVMNTAASAVALSDLNKFLQVHHYLLFDLQSTHLSFYT